ncbi:MAG: ABC transporter ATP-binding protein [Firmicutes bacterium]|uniref:ABC transporter ATP-binding protein n=1 Tax=Geochorda subterranea TaxID=3109564 RepID=A0ABZ1BU35_9FIRM|nr:ABC transporter ATP-binding protein [Limnochorda sp. LNt]NLG67949.1 ABC transporter ATP-binding protein [Bacillota bacterium]WRP15980.1 ABC transporter ATP-binding protein [Limnochorda sp. LNt]
MLEVHDLTVRYGNIEALRDVSLRVDEGDVVALIGANGAGKTTTLRAISGLVRPYRGSIRYRGQELTRLSAERVTAMGIAHVPEGRAIFANLSVQENLLLATYARRDRSRVQEDLDLVYSLLPRLAERRRQNAGTLSGGEQQMLAIGRALMSRAQVMLLDEPSMGLAPVLVVEIFRLLQEINRQGTTLLLVEQNARMALQIARRAYVLEAGRIVLAGAAREVASDPAVRDAYLGAA